MKGHEKRAVTGKFACQGKIWASQSKPANPEAPFYFLLTPEKPGDIFILETKENRYRTKEVLGHTRYFLSFFLLKECKARQKLS